MTATEFAEALRALVSEAEHDGLAHEILLAVLDDKREVMRLAIAEASVANDPDRTDQPPAWLTRIVSAVERIGPHPVIWTVKSRGPFSTSFLSAPSWRGRGMAARVAGRSVGDAAMTANGAPGGLTHCGALCAGSGLRGAGPAASRQAPAAEVDEAGPAVEGSPEGFVPQWGSVAPRWPP